MKRKVHIIVGARPNYIKAYPVFKILNNSNLYEVILINTGQHYNYNMITVNPGFNQSILLLLLIYYHYH